MMAFLKNKKEAQEVQSKDMIEEKSAEIEQRKSDWLNDEDGELVLDVWQTPKEVIVQAPVAGVKTEDIEISMEGNSLKIKGKREGQKTIKEDNYLIKECFWGSFSRQVLLPVEVNKSKIEADIKEGILTVKLPKKSVKEKQEKIKIKE